MEEVLKQYDKLLTHKKNLDGSVNILRQSPFDSRKQHKVLVIIKQYVGSGRWVLQKLISMDTTRYDLVGKAMRNNWAIRQRKESRNMHEEIADLMLSGEKFIN